jgi:Leucine-rich repeat (LRR) protein
MKKMMLLALLASANVQILAMEPEMVTLQSNDGTDLRIPLQIANRAETIRLLIEDAGTNDPIPLPTLDGKTLERMIKLMTSLNTLLVFNEKQQKTNPEKQIYIPRRFQHRILKIVKHTTNREIGQLFDAANYLDVPFILNGAAAEIADRIYKKISGNWNTTDINEKLDVTSHTAKRIQKIALREGFGKIQHDAIEFVVKHVIFRKVGITQERSIADYINDHGQPELVDDCRAKDGSLYVLKELKFSKQGFIVPPNEAFTSLFGIESLQRKNEIQELDLRGYFYDFNLDVQGIRHPFAALPQLRRLGIGAARLVRLPSGLFEGAEQLEYLSLGHNELTSLPTSLPMNIFSKLHKLEELYLNSNLLSTLPNPEKLFGNLKNLRVIYLNYNPITPDNLKLIRMAIREIAPNASVHFEN